MSYTPVYQASSPPAFNRRSSYLKTPTGPVKNYSRRFTLAATESANISSHQSSSSVAVPGSVNAPRYTLPELRPYSPLETPTEVLENPLRRSTFVATESFNTPSHRSSAPDTESINAQFLRSSAATTEPVNAHSRRSTLAEHRRSSYLEIPTEAIETPFRRSTLAATEFVKTPSHPYSVAIPESVKVHRSTLAEHRRSSPFETPTEALENLLRRSTITVSESVNAPSRRSSLAAFSFRRSTMAASVNQDNFSTQDTSEAFKVPSQRVTIPSSSGIPRSRTFTSFTPSASLSPVQESALPSPAAVGPDTWKTSNPVSTADLRAAHPGKLHFGIQEQAFWAGRFSSTMSKLLEEEFKKKLEKGDFELTESELILDEDNWGLRQAEVRAGRTVPGYTMTVEMVISDEEFLLSKQAFKKLAGECGDAAALRSLEAFQEQYARNKETRELLPPGSFMTEGEKTAHLNRASGKKKEEEALTVLFAESRAFQAQKEKEETAAAAAKKSLRGKVSGFFRRKSG